jgi:hypothetical protein
MTFNITPYFSIVFFIATILTDVVVVHQDPIIFRYIFWTEVYLIKYVHCLKPYIYNMFSILWTSMV